MLAVNLAYLLRGDRAAQAAVAEAVGVGQPTISKWSRLAVTNSHSEPEFRKMARLARHMGVSLDDLAWRDLENDPPHSASQPMGLALDRMAVVLEVVDGAIADSRKRVPPKFRANLVKRVYEMPIELTPDTTETVRTMLVALMENDESE